MSAVRYCHLGLVVDTVGRKYLKTGHEFFLLRFIASVQVTIVGNVLIMIASRGAKIVGDM